MSEILRGLSAFTLTPMDAAGIVDTDHLQRLIARLAATDMASIGVLGSTGSYMYLSAEQRARALAAAVEASAGKPILAGIGDLRTDAVLAHVKAAEVAKVQALLLAPVSYLPLTDADFTSLVQAVARESDLPICLYNNPNTTHVDLSPDLVVELSQIERVAAVKNPAPLSGPHPIEARRSEMPDGFVLGYSGDAAITSVLGAGADAWYSVLAGTLPDVALGLWDARHDPVQLQRLNAKADLLWQLFRTFGGIRVVPELARQIGLGDLSLPLPLQALPRSGQVAVEEALSALSG